MDESRYIVFLRCDEACRERLCKCHNSRYQVLVGGVWVETEEDEIVFIKYIGEERRIDRARSKKESYGNFKAG
jgi:hypothetical protein